MILTDREILLAIEKKAIVIDPVPSPSSFSSTTVDLRLDEDLYVWQQINVGGAPMPIPLGSPGYNLKLLSQQHLTRIVTSSAVPFILLPQAFVLGWTHEKVGLPIDSRLGARVEGKSSVARLGVGIHVTAPTIHPGFGGYTGNRIQLEIFNLGPNPVQLLPMIPICQLIFEQTLGTPESGYAGQFKNQ